MGGIEFLYSGWCSLTTKIPFLLSVEYP